MEQSAISTKEGVAVADDAADKNNTKSEVAEECETGPAADNQQLEGSVSVITLTPEQRGRIEQSRKAALERKRLRREHVPLPQPEAVEAAAAPAAPETREAQAAPEDWAPVSEPGFLDFQVFRFLLL